MNRSAWKRRRMKERSRWGLGKQDVLKTIGFENRFEYMCLYMLLWSRLTKLLPSCTSPQESNSSFLNMICNICALFEIPFQLFFLDGGSCFITFFSFLLFGVVCAFFLFAIGFAAAKDVIQAKSTFILFLDTFAAFFHSCCLFFQGVHKSHM